MNCKKLRLSLLLVGLCLCFILIARVDAQLNFSTGWGKRNNQGTTITRNSDARSRFFKGHPYADLYARYYRQLRKMEEQRFTDDQI